MSMDSNTYNQTLLVVAAILTNTAAASAETYSAESTVDRYFEVLEELKGRGNMLAPKKT